MAKRKAVKFPSIESVAAALRDINAESVGGYEHECNDDSCEECGGIDVRLQVYEDGRWAVRSGLSDYDQDHRGFWGTSSVPGNRKRFRSTEVARDLLAQCRDDESQHAFNRHSVD